MIENPNQIVIKQYDTFAISCEYSDDEGTPIALDDLTITADFMNTAGTVVDSFIVAITDAAAGLFDLITTKDRFDPGTYRTDLLITHATGRVSSDTLTVTIVPAVTAPRSAGFGHQPMQNMQNEGR